MGDWVELALWTPTGESQREKKVEFVQRLDNLEGKTIGLFANSKANSDIFLTRVGELLEEQFKKIKLIKYFPGKCGAGAPCSPSVIKKVAGECEGIVIGQGD